MGFSYKLAAIDDELTHRGHLPLDSDAQMVAHLTAKGADAVTQH